VAKSRVGRLFTPRHGSGQAGRQLGRALAATAALGFAVLAYVYLTLPDVRVLEKTNPKTTAFMELRAREAARDGKTIRHQHVWVPYSRISQSLKRAVLVAEDSAFWEHEGVDVEQIRESIQVNWEQGRAIRGASTITQQLAKNLYLSPSRDPLRKLRELIIARRMEAALPKARIFEIYLNVIEWGDGIWGAEAAARTYFGVPASALGPSQAALLAGAIINPRVLNPARPTRRLLSRQRIILGRMGAVTPPTAVPVVATTPDEATEEQEQAEPLIEFTGDPVPPESPAGEPPLDAAPPPDATAPPPQPLPPAPPEPQ
jgi:monofunctional biosynthetic peptidoglycan transglycosylase